MMIRRVSCQLTVAVQVAMGYTLTFGWIESQSGVLFRVEDTEG